MSKVTEKCEANTDSSHCATSSRETIVCDGNMQAARIESLATGTVAIYSQRSHEKEPPNEDSAVVIPIGQRGVVLAVADGVGGMPEGQKASRVALETLVESLSKARESTRLRVSILDAIEKANRRILAMKAGATTLAIAQIVDHRVRTYHVGDSEVIVVGGGGVLKLQTLSHGPVAYGVHCGLIDPDEAMVHEARNLVSNVVGDRDMRIEIGPVRRLAVRDVVLLCSDGITDNLTIPEIADRISGKPIEAAAESIIEGLRIRREQNADRVFKEDDATFLIYRRNRAPSKEQSEPLEQPEPEAELHPPLESTA